MISKNIRTLSMALFDPDDLSVLDAAVENVAILFYRLSKAILTYRKTGFWSVVMVFGQLMKVMSRPINVFITNKNYFKPTISIVIWFDIQNNGKLWRRVKTRTSQFIALFFISFMSDFVLHTESMFVNKIVAFAIEIH